MTKIVVVAIVAYVLLMMWKDYMVIVGQSNKAIAGIKAETGTTAYQGRRDSLWTLIFG